MNNAAKRDAIETAASEAGVSVSFYNSTSVALGQGNHGEPDKCSVSSKDFSALARFRNILVKAPAIAGSKITKTVACAGYWNMGFARDVSYIRTVTL